LLIYKVSVEVSQGTRPSRPLPSNCLPRFSMLSTSKKFLGSFFENNVSIMKKNPGPIFSYRVY